MSDPDVTPPEGVTEETAAAPRAGAGAATPEDVAAIPDDLEIDIELLLKEREEYLELSRRLQADFENYKKRVVKQQTEHLERAGGAVIEKLLPVLDNFDLALQHGAEGLEPIYRGLLDVLAGEGLERLDPQGRPFDPNEHDAVVHEEGEAAHPEVVEVLRAGYRYKGRVLRPAMV